MNARRVEALRAMAQADESPHEQAIAQAKLTEAGIPIVPPRPPAPPAAPAPMPFGWGVNFTGTTTATSSTSTWVGGSAVFIRVTFG